MGGVYNLRLLRSLGEGLTLVVLEVVLFFRIFLLGTNSELILSSRGFYGGTKKGRERRERGREKD
jgi:hypothetical protein